MILNVNVGPSTILGEISEIAIYAVKRRAIGSLAHIGQKVFEYLPSLAYSYASSAVIGIFFVLGPLTSPFHGLPRNPSWRQRHSMFCDGNAMALPTEASARRYLASFKCIAANLFGLAAVAAAKPTQVLALCLGQSKNYKVGEALTGKGIWRHHSHKITYIGG